MRSRAWYYKEPGSFYGLGPVRFREPITEREFRANLREVLQVERLPRGTQVWRAI